MAHPKSRVSTQRKRKRRTHYKLGLPKIAVCKTTGESHLYHRAYEHEGALYYKGQMVVPAKETRIEEIEE